jgi:hypothetical protein
MLNGLRIVSRRRWQLSPSTLAEIWAVSIIIIWPTLFLSGFKVEASI